MMDKIRSAANHIVVKIIFGIIILSFIFSGIGFFGFGGNSERDVQQYIAKVDGEGINRQEFEQIVLQNKAQFVNLAGDDQNLEKQYRREILSNLISNNLAYKLSKHLNANISEKQVTEAIQKNPVFFVDNKFNNDKYNSLLAQNGLQPEIYFNALRSELQQQQMVDALVNSSFVLPIDNDLSRLKNERRLFYYTAVTPSMNDVKDSEITLADEKKYYEENINSFARKERIKYKYIINAKKDYSASIIVDDNEIKKYFTQHSKDYWFPNKKAFSIIYIDDKKVADETVNQLKNSEDFVQLVESLNKQNSNNPLGKNGSIGWFSEDENLLEPLKKANLTKIGQISKPIAYEDGYLFIKLDDIQKGKLMDYDYAKLQIKYKLANQKLDKVFLQKEQELKTALKDPNANLEDIAAKTGLKVREENWATYKSNSNILSYPEVKDVAFSDEMIEDNHAKGTISEMIPVGNGDSMADIVFQVIDYHPEGIASFDEVQKNINAKLTHDIAISHFNNKITDIVAELNEKGKSDKVQFQNKLLITRDSTELDTSVVHKVFDMVPKINKATTFDAQMIDNKLAYIIALIDVKPVATVTDISAQLKPLIEYNDYKYFLESLRSNVKIEIMPNSNL